MAAAEAGAAVLQPHARNPEDGSPSADPALFAEYAKAHNLPLMPMRSIADDVTMISAGQVRERGPAMPAAGGPCRNGPRCQPGSLAPAGSKRPPCRHPGAPARLSELGQPRLGTAGNGRRNRPGRGNRPRQVGKPTAQAGEACVVVTAATGACG